MAGSQSTQGANYVIFGLIDPATGNLIADEEKGLSKSGIVLIDGDGEGVTVANITQLEEAGTQQYANNKVKRTAHGVPAPQLALTMLDIQYEIAMKLIGYQKDAAGGYVLGGQKPHVALLVCSDGINSGKTYDCFANGEMIQGTKNHSTSNRNEVDANAQFTYNALTPIANDVFLNPDGTQRPYAYWNSGDKDFDSMKMLKEVFKGYAGDDLTKTFIQNNAATSGTPVSGNDKNGISNP